MGQSNLAYEVKVCLPEQTVKVWAKDEADAEFRAWHMIGFAGVRAYGTMKATRVAPPAVSAVTQHEQQ